MARLYMVVPLVVVVVFMGVVAQVDAVGYCPSFCDPNGYYHESHHCHKPSVYCCGSAFQRYCCANHSHDITSYYPDKYNCNTATWMQVHWQVMITMTGSILLVLLFSACCCQCCRMCSERAMQADHRVRFSSPASNVTAIVTDEDGNQYVAEGTDATTADGGQVTIQMFNPDSPYAFTPPEYESLPKDPPKYNDVITLPDGGTLNPCYVPDSPPPPFSEVDGATGPPLPTPQIQREDNNEAMASSVNSGAIMTENATAAEVEDDVARDEVKVVSPATDVVIAGGFVDVDLTVDNADDAGRPLTSNNKQTEHVQEEAQERCLPDTNDALESER